MTGKSFEQLTDIMKRLRREDGCPWDREQTHQSLKSYLIEETYEVLEALENEDYDHLSEELGDLLFSVVKWHFMYLDLLSNRCKFAWEVSIQHNFPDIMDDTRSEAFFVITGI